MYPTAYAADCGRCATFDSQLCGPLQQAAVTQRPRLCNTAGYAAGSSSSDPRGTGPQTGTGALLTTTASAASRQPQFCRECDYNDFARGNRGRHCRDATVLRDTRAGLIEPTSVSAGAHRS